MESCLTPGTPIPANLNHRKGIPEWPVDVPGEVERLGKTDVGAENRNGYGRQPRVDYVVGGMPHPIPRCQLTTRRDSREDEEKEKKEKRKKRDRDSKFHVGTYRRKIPDMERLGILVVETTTPVTTRHQTTKRGF